MPFEPLAVLARGQPQLEDAFINGTFFGKIVGETLRATVPQQELIFVPGNHRGEGMRVVKLA